MEVKSGISEDRLVLYSSSKILKHLIVQNVLSDCIEGSKIQVVIV